MRIEEARLLNAAWYAYCVLLAQPLTVRIQIQPVLSRLRDAIASELRQEPEYVQDTAEAVAQKGEVFFK